MMVYHEDMADREEARELSRFQSEHAWVLTNRDAWHLNPFYVGPEQPHPEDDYAHDYIAEHGIEAWRTRNKATSIAGENGLDTYDDAETPF